jgi:hypothetical protein
VGHDPDVADPGQVGLDVGGHLGKPLECRVCLVR